MDEGVLLPSSASFSFEGGAAGAGGGPSSSSHLGSMRADDVISWLMLHGEMDGLGLGPLLSGITAPNDMNSMGYGREAPVQSQGASAALAGSSAYDFEIYDFQSPIEKMGILDDCTLNSTIEGSSLNTGAQSDSSLSCSDDDSHEDDRSSAAGTAAKPGGAPKSARAPRKRAAPSSSDKLRSNELSKERRRRRVARLDDMEQRVNELREENECLKSHLVNVTQKKADLRRQKTAMQMEMYRLFSMESSPENHQRLFKLLQEYTELNGDYGASRQKEVAYHLYQLEKLVLPSRVTRMAMWTLNQDATFFENSSRSPIMEMLSQELGLSPDQLTKIQDHRNNAKTLTSRLKETIDVMNELGVAIGAKHAAFDRAVADVQSKLSLKQTVAFFKWFGENSERLLRVIPDFDRLVAYAPPKDEAALTPTAPAEGTVTKQETSSSSK